MGVEKIRQELLAMKDLGYKEFQKKLIPTVEEERIIGIRTPILRKYSVKLAKQQEVREFLQALPHYYYEENNLHGFLVERIEDYDRCIQELDIFLPYVDNWATCDGTVPKILKKEPEQTLIKAAEWIKSDRTYVCRYGIKVLMDHFLEENFSEEILKLVAGVNSEEYYVRMMQAWFFATALAKQYEAALSFLKNKSLDVWVHNKTIQKARESYRISPGQKEELKGLKSAYSFPNLTY